jgi:hypothetical protein
MIRNKRNTIRYYKVDNYDIVAYKQVRAGQGTNDKGELVNYNLPAICYVIHGPTVQNFIADLYANEEQREQTWKTLGSPEDLDYMRGVIVDLENLIEGK